MGDLASRLEHAIKAVELLDDDAPAAMRAMHTLRLADALDECGSSEEARAYHERAEQVAVLGGQAARQVTCLNNRAYGEYLSGDGDAGEGDGGRH